MPIYFDIIQLICKGKNEEQTVQMIIRIIIVLFVFILLINNKL